jgi:acetyl-CoA acyltransferase 1
MGISPIFAIPALYKYTGVSQSDVEIFELNEAFASQAVYCIEKLGLDREKVNPNGGAIAIGHPTGATGARQTATLFAELKRSGGEIGVVSMCARYVFSLHPPYSQKY